jgi:hypothetical protein
LTNPENRIQIVAERPDEGGVITPRIADKYDASITVTAPELYWGVADCRSAIADAE